VGHTLPKTVPIPASTAPGQFRRGPVPAGHPHGRSVLGQHNPPKAGGGLTLVVRARGRAAVLGDSQHEGHQRAVASARRQVQTCVALRATFSLCVREGSRGRSGGAAAALAVRLPLCSRRHRRAVAAAAAAAAAATAAATSSSSSSAHRRTSRPMTGVGRARFVVVVDAPP